MTEKPAEPTAAPAPGTVAQASVYQRLRGHLAALKLHAAAEHLPGVLETATADGLSLTAALERLLAIEVEATRGPPARRPAPVRVPAQPRDPGRIRLRRRPRRRPAPDRRARHLPLPRHRDQRAAARPTSYQRFLTRRLLRLQR